MRKPERFVRAVEPYHYNVTIFDEPMATKYAVVLLRRQYAQLRRLVKQEIACTTKENWGPAFESEKVAYLRACLTILRSMTAWRGR